MQFLSMPLLRSPNFLPPQNSQLLFVTFVFIICRSGEMNTYAGNQKNTVVWPSSNSCPIRYGDRMSCCTTRKFTLIHINLVDSLYLFFKTFNIIAIWDWQRKAQFTVAYKNTSWIIFLKFIIPNPVKSLSSQQTHCELTWKLKASSFWSHSSTSQWTHKMSSLCELAVSTPWVCN